MIAAIQKPERVDKLILMNAEIERHPAFEIAQSASVSAMMNDPKNKKKCGTNYRSIRNKL